MITDNLPDVSKAQNKIKEIRTIIDKFNLSLEKDHFTFLDFYVSDNLHLSYIYKIIVFDGSVIGQICIEPADNKIRMYGKYGTWERLRMLAKLLPQDMEITLDVYRD